VSERYEALTLEMMERLVNAADEIGIQLSRMNDIADHEAAAPAREDPALLIPTCPECFTMIEGVWYGRPVCEGCGSTWGISGPNEDTP
jgi:hypothetical protein